MASVTNMDNQKNPNSTVPQLEFTLPMDEVKEHVEVGQIGDVTIPCEVIMVRDGMISFRKRGQARSEGAFTQATAAQMRDMLPKADEMDDDKEEDED